MKPKPIFPLVLSGLFLICCAVWVGYRAPLEHRASRGRPEPQYQLGKCYYYGLGMSRDYSQAARWFELAARQNHAKAQTVLGKMYVSGTGVARNFSTAVSWFRLAAKNNQPEAENQLGMLYAQGHGVPQDFDQAAQWFERAASHGSRAAEQNLKLLAAMRPGFLASLTLRNGKTYKAVRVQKVEWDSMTVSFHPDKGGIGVARLPFAELPQALQRKYGYNPASLPQLANSTYLASVAVQPL